MDPIWAHIDPIWARVGSARAHEVRETGYLTLIWEIVPWSSPWEGFHRLFKPHFGLNNYADKGTILLRSCPDLLLTP